MEYAIIPLKGFDKVKFGQTREQVLSILGQPDEIDEDACFGDSPEEKTTVFYYDELGLSFSFEKEEGYRLSEMSFDSDEFVLCGKIRVGMDMEEVLKLASTCQIGEGEDISYEAELDENSKLWEYEEGNVGFYFENGVLSTIQIGPEFSEDGNEIIWPQ